MTTDFNSPQPTGNTPNGPEAMHAAANKKKDLIIGLLVIISSACTQCFALNFPEPFNPWTQESATKAPGGLDSGEYLFLEAMALEKRTKVLHGSSTDKDKDEFKEKILDSVEKGNIKAKLIQAAHNYGMKIPDEYTLNVFRQVTQSGDPQLLYEVGKLMQLFYLSCLNVEEKDGTSLVERRCVVSKNEYPYSKMSYAALTAANDALTSKRLDRFFGYILRSAMMGYPQAQYEIGYLLMKGGESLPKNAKELDGMGVQAVDWLQKAAKSSNPEAISLLSMLKKEKKATDDRMSERSNFEKEHAASKPKCVNIVFTGIASAGNPHFIDQALASNNAQDMLARNPIICEYKEWGGHPVNGGYINRNKTTECHGISHFNNKHALIVNWVNKYYIVETDLDFNFGRKKILLAIQASDAKCIN